MLRSYSFNGPFGSCVFAGPSARLDNKNTARGWARMHNFYARAALVAMGRCGSRAPWIKCAAGQGRPMRDVQYDAQRSRRLGRSEVAGHDLMLGLFLRALFFAVRGLLEGLQLPFRALPP